MLKEVAVCSWSLQTDTVADLLQAIGLCGLRQTQLALLPYMNNDTEYASLRAAVASGQMAICSGMFETVGEDYSTLERIKHTGGLRPDEHWNENLRRASSCAQITHDLGLDLVTFHAGFIPEHDPALQQTMVERLIRVAEVFNDKGITLGLETGQERSETLLELLSTISTRVRVGVNFDPANMILYGMGDPIHAMHELEDFIVQVHMKDAIATATPGTWGAEVTAGLGQVDWDAFFDAVHAHRDPINVVIEREAGTQRVADIRAALRLAQHHIGRVKS